MLPIDKTYLKTNLNNWKTAILDPAYIIQKATLPTASAQNLGVVFQYIGANSSTMTKGGFYECQIVPNTDPVEYAWVEISTKTLTDGVTILTNSNKELYVPKATSSTLGVVKAGDGTSVDSNGVISVVARLEEIDELPTAAAALEGKIYLLTATQTGYDRGGIYMCEESTETAGTYEWKLISMSPLEAGKGITIENDVISADTNIFPGTLDEWNALTPAEQANYDFVVSPDEASEKTIFANNAGAHNSFYRGEYLGSTVTIEQYAQINAGTFDNLFIGDYWTIGGVNYRIAHFDYWRKAGYPECTKHHVVVVPDTNFAKQKMNNTNTTAGGYVGSTMYTTNLAAAKNAINTAFGSFHILSHPEMFTKTVADGKASDCSWYDSTVDLMNECMVHGHNAWGSHHGYETGIDKSQLALFSLMPEFICNYANWWLRDVVSDTDFATVNMYGVAAHGNAANANIGVRPAFAIIG